MTQVSQKMKALILAGFISGLLITAIANLSYATQQKSVLEFDKPGSSCVMSICSLV